MVATGRRRGSAAFACGLLCLLLAPQSAAAVEDVAAPIFRAEAVDVIDLHLPQASFETLEDEPEENYVEGTFSFAEGDGTPEGVGPFTTPQMVGIRLKGGSGSFRGLRDEKAAFKVKFNFENSKGEKGKKFLGLKKLTLNNMVQDPSMLHETMAYEAFRALGVPAPRTGYANVYVNGVNYGVHLNVETYDDISLPHFFADTQHLYEADTPGVDVRPGGAGEFEVDEGDEEDLTDLEALIAAANDESGDWSDGMSGLADLDELARMWAVERYVGHWDGYAGVPVAVIPPVRPNNYYLHSDESGLFSMLPWGTDQTWDDDVEFDQPAGGLLFNKCFADTSCKGQYVEALREAQGAIGGLELGDQATCLSERLAPWQALEDSGRREYDAGEIAEGVAGAEEFIADRPGELADWLSTQPGEGEGSAAGPAAPCGPLPVHPPDDRTVPTLAEAQAASADRPQATPGRLDLLGLLPGRQWLRVEARTDAPGLFTIAGKMHTRKGGLTVCAHSRLVSRAGKSSLACRLSRAARLRLRSRGLRLHVIVGFAPDGAESETRTRDVSVPFRRSAR